MLSTNVKIIRLDIVRSVVNKYASRKITYLGPRDEGKLITPVQFPEG